MGRKYTITSFLGKILRIVHKKNPVLRGRMRESSDLDCEQACETWNYHYEKNLLIMFLQDKSKRSVHLFPDKTDST